MQISVPVTFDATNQTMSVSDSSLITFPQNTSDFSIVTVNGTACLTPTTVSTARANYVTFVLANTVTEIEFDSYITIPSASWNWNLWFELVVPGPTYYSLTYEPQGNWHNPDGLSCDLATGTWYTIKVTSTTVNIYNKSNGTLVHTRSLVGMPSDLSIANFIGSTSYLANLVLKKVINTEAIRYANTSGIAEIWANIKNWVLAHIGNGTLTIQKNGTDVTTFSANSSSNAIANITVPTKVSDLTNDSGFLTTATIPSKTSDLTNDSGFITSNHTHTKSDITDLFNSANTWTGDNTYSKAVGFTKVNDTTLYTQNSRAELGETNISGDTYTQISFEDKNGDNFGYLRQTYYVDGDNRISIYVRNKFTSGAPSTSGTADYAYFGLRLNADKSKEGVLRGTFRPYDNNTYDLGSSTNQWKSVYAKNYYLGTTAFGDIVTHNASEFLTSHQSLSNYVTLDSDQTISGAKTFTGDVIGINKNSSTEDANSLYSATAGSKLTYYTTTNSLTTLTNVPAAVNTTLESRTIRRLSDSDWIVEQICHNGNGLYYRKGSNGTWGVWKTFAFTDSSISGNAATATQFSANKDVTLTGDVTGTASSKAGWSVVTTLSDSGVTAGTYGPSADVTGNNNATISVPEITVDAKGRVTSVTNRTLTCKNNTYSVYNKTLTIQKNGTNVATFTSNSNTDVTANITVPTKVSELSNDSGFLTSHQSLSNYSTLANTVKSLSISGKTITVTPGSGSAYTLTTQDTVYTHPTTSGNKHIPSGGSSGQFLGWDSDGTAKWVNNPNTNTDTLVNQNVSTANNTYPVLIAHTANATANLGAKEAYFGKDIKINPSTGALYATKLYSNNVEVLTSHQSLSNYVTLNGAQTISATKSFSTAITTASTSTSQRETWGIAFTKTDTNGGGASALGVVQGKNSNDFCSILRLSNPRGNNKPTSGNGVNTGNCWGGIGVYFNFALNRGYPYAPSCDRWADSSNSDNELAATSWVRRYCETTKKFLTSHQSLSNYSTLANTVKSLSISGKTITVTPGSGSAYTLTTQDTVYTHPTTAGNKHIPSGGSSGQILKYSSSGTAVWADVSFTRQMASVATDGTSGDTAASGSYLPRDKTVTLTSSQLAVVTIDVTTSSPLMVKLTATNIFVVAIHTLVGTNGYKQDAVNYGSILQQTAAGRSRVVALILPYASSVKFTLVVHSGGGNITSYSLAVYQ